MSLRKEIDSFKGTHELELPKMDSNFYEERSIALIIRLF